MQMMKARERPSEKEQYQNALSAVKSGESAKTQLAFFMLSGRGGAKVDADRGVVLLEERAKDNDKDAKWMLGLCCEYGIGTEQDIPRAESLYSQSCQLGSIIGTILMNNVDRERSKRGGGYMKLTRLS